MGSLHDAYELGGVAGHGRTTIVRLGVRRGDCAAVALKQLRLEHTQDPDKRGRFVEQARRACMLHHESIEAMLDVVEGRDGPVAIAEWIDGRSLHRLAAARRRKDEPWPVQEVALIARALLEALRHAHHQPIAFDVQGMLHGGLWPGNVLVDVDGCIKLVDFGLAAVWQEAREPWQDVDALRYLSADHVRHGASAAADLYAVGAIVHELLAGQRFRDECETEADMRALIERPGPPDEPREDVPVPLERLRRRLLEPGQSPRQTLEHVLDLCAAVPLGRAREGLCALVRDTLRNDSTASEPDPTPPRGMPVAAMAVADAREELTKARARGPAAVQGGLGIELQQVPLGQAPRRPRRRDTPSGPVRVDHEPRAPRSGEQAIAAKRERSGRDPTPDPDADPVRTEAPEEDTAPLPLDEAAVPKAISAEEDAPNLLVETDVTAEVLGIPRLPEDESLRAPSTDTAGHEPVPGPYGLTPRLGLLRGPLGWALLGAAVVGLGVPLLSRCGAAEPTEPPTAKRSR